MRSVGFLCTCIFFFSMLMGFAQPPSDVDTKDPKAREILKKLSDNTKALKSFSADFTYTLKNKDANLDETETGQILASGEKYNLKISGQQIITDGKVIWTYIEDADEVTIDNLGSEDENDLNPAKLFTIYDEGFKYKFEGEASEGGKTIQTVKLFPIDANAKPFHTVILKINKVANQISSIQIKMKDGNNFTYIIDKFVKDAPINDSSFNFDTSEVGDVIDLRD